MGLMGLVGVLAMITMLAFPLLMRRLPVSTIISLGAALGIVGAAIMLFAGANLLLIGLSSFLTGVAILPITFLSQLLIIDNASSDETAELLARVDALYRRIGGSENTEDVLSSGPFVLHLRSRTLDALAGAQLYSTSIPCADCQAWAAGRGVARMFVGPQARDAGAPRGR